MSTRDPNFSATVMVALFSLITVVGLVLVLAFPVPFTRSRWVCWAALAGLFVALPILTRLAQRSRIRHAVEQDGGRLLRLRRLPFWRQPAFLSRSPMSHGARYSVEFADALGTRYRGLCRSGFLIGVQWLDCGPIPT